MGPPPMRFVINRTSHHLPGLLAKPDKKPHPQAVWEEVRAHGHLIPCWVLWVRSLEELRSMDFIAPIIIHFYKEEAMGVDGHIEIYDQGRE